MQRGGRCTKIRTFEFTKNSRVPCSVWFSKILAWGIFVLTGRYVQYVNLLQYPNYCDAGTDQSSDGLNEAIRSIT